MTAYLIKLRQNYFQFTLITALLLGLALAYFLEKTALFFLRETPSTKVSPVNFNFRKSQPKARAALGPEALLEIATGNLLRHSLPEPVVEETEAPFSMEGLSLIGTVAGNARYARASIMQQGKKQAKAYAIGDELNGAAIAAIATEYVVFRNSAGELYRLYLARENKPSQGAPKKTAHRSIKAPQGQNVKKVNLSRDRFRQLISDQADLFRLKFAPSIQGGKINGWRLLKVPSDHFLHSLGARSGDVIRRYNGQKLENQERMFNMWQSLKTANQVLLDVERGGKPLVFDISIQ